MAKQLQLRGGTTAQHSTFTGAVREVTVDTDKDVVVVHDGATVGGFPMAKKSDVDSAIGTAVLLTGNQTIAGTKTFSSTITGSITGNAGSATIATTADSCTGNSATATTASSCSGNSATATSATSATTATNLAGGSLGTIPYQSASGTTAQLAPGTSGYYLKSNGAAAPSWAAVAAGDSAPTGFQDFTASGNWTCPAGVTRVTVMLAGGGGGGAGGGLGAAGIAGASTIAKTTIVEVTAGTVYAITIGAGGLRGYNQGVAGSVGGTTSFGSLATSVGSSGGVGNVYWGGSSIGEQLYRAGSFSLGSDSGGNTVYHSQSSRSACFKTTGSTYGRGGNGGAGGSGPTYGVTGTAGALSIFW